MTRRSRSFGGFSQVEVRSGPTPHPRAGVCSVSPNPPLGLVRLVEEEGHLEEEEGARGRLQRLGQRVVPGVRSGRRTRAQQARGQICSAHNLQLALAPLVVRISLGRTSQRPARSALHQVRIHAR